mmetsp:Transcript_1337/g.4632  ORF Transcript_1337/g.4632 Transcript_1337/m.4632 type:complete len:235 (+) Transcript_1337:87-791(+)
MGPASHHVALGPAQRWVVGFGAAVGALLRPERGDLVATVAETTGELAFRRIHKQMLESEEGRAILTDKPIVTTQTFARAWELPTNTLGGAYAHFMRKRSFVPEERAQVRFIDDPELAYVAQRAREVHDLWHVLFDCPTTIQGELALKWVELLQTGLPMCALSVAAGPLRLRPPQFIDLHVRYVPWALRAARACTPLMSIRYEDYLEEDLCRVREKWGIITAPPARRRTVKVLKV